MPAYQQSALSADYYLYAVIANAAKHAAPFISLLKHLSYHYRKLLLYCVIWKRNPTNTPQLNFFLVLI
jgi:hypothetical protein